MSALPCMSSVTHTVSAMWDEVRALRVENHLEVSCADQVHHHGEWRLPRHADRVQLLVASVEWQLLLWPHLEAMLVFQVFRPAGNTLLAQWWDLYLPACCTSACIPVCLPSCRVVKSREDQRTHQHTSVSL